MAAMDRYFPSTVEVLRPEGGMFICADSRKVLSIGDAAV